MNLIGAPGNFRRVDVNGGGALTEQESATGKLRLAPISKGHTSGCAGPLVGVCDVLCEGISGSGCVGVHWVGLVGCAVWLGWKVSLGARVGDRLGQRDPCIEFPTRGA